ncbi:unnamed protein product [Owenia fusiformis]|uniref:B box-type domain-containing protein n=1 Tax=Owenia fusiformis TaxID=6347 RepID=A0A8S4P172_OWEFU|nr:unnamed protein product [Owenia fusiformis]
MATDKANDETFPKCEFCLKLDSSYFCHDCTSFLCNTCIQPHNEHSRVTIETNLRLFCDKHKFKIRDVYCKSCNAITCKLCHIHGHNGHDSIKVCSDKEEELKEVAKEGLDEIRCNLPKTINYVSVQLINDRDSILEKIANMLSNKQKDLSLRSKSIENDITENMDPNKINTETLIQDFHTYLNTRIGVISAIAELYEIRMDSIEDTVEDINSMSQSNSIKCAPAVVNKPKLDEEEQIITDDDDDVIDEKVPPDDKHKDECENLAPDDTSEAESLDNFGLSLHPSKYYILDNKSGQLAIPGDLQFKNNGNLIIADYKANRIVELNLSFDSNHKPSTTPILEINEPKRILLVDNDDMFIIRDKENVLNMLKDGKMEYLPFNVEVDTLRGIGRCKNGDVIVTDINRHHAIRYNLDNPTDSERRRESIFGCDVLKCPGFVTIGENGNIYISDAHANAIHVFDGYCDHIGTMSSYECDSTTDGEQPRHLEWPAGICQGPCDSIIVADLGNRCISIFDPSTRKGVRRLISDIKDGQPNAVAFDPERRRLAFCTYGSIGMSPTVQVFQF